MILSSQVHRRGRAESLGQRQREDGRRNDSRERESWLELRGGGCAASGAEAAAKGKVQF